jgi:serine phosphatase RsbU (regulator of sigma subunit)
MWYKNIQTVFITFLLTVSLSMPIFAQAPNPKAVKGVMDLRQWHFEQIADVSGEWELYWGQLLSTKQEEGNFVYQTVSGKWNEVIWENVPVGAMGYGTYHVQVLLPEGMKGKRLGIKVGYINTAYQLFVQGEKLGGVGKVATQEADYTPNLNPQFYTFEIQKDTLDIRIEVANFQYRYGGVTGNIRIGEEKHIIQQHQLKNNFLFFIMGILLIMGLYHLSLYFFRKKNIAALHFGLLCITITFRMTVTDEYPITDFFENFPFQISTKVSYCSFYLAVLLAVNFFHAVYPLDFSIKIRNAIRWIAVIYTLITLLTYISFYGQFLTLFQVITLLLLIYIGYFTVKIIRLKRTGSFLFMIGLLALGLATINDILHANETIQTFIAAPLGLLVFIFSQTLLLSSLFSKSFQKVEDLSEELRQVNNNLENTVKQRTVELGNTNEELALTNEKLNQVLEETRQTLEVVEEQRVKLSETNQEITASLKYAQRIQQNILPKLAIIQKALPETFILFRPRDIVSGDFYWFTEIGGQEGKVVLAAIDCTGHGVPGAFMTMISYQLLDEIVNNRHIMEADQILNYLNRSVRKVMRQEETNNREGMDISLVVIDKKQRKLEFAGAKNPIIYIQNGNLFHIKGDRISIGDAQIDVNIHFNKHTIDISTPTTFYLFSDGYQDQFGGTEGKKIMVKQMKDLFLEISALSIADQRQHVEQYLTQWIEDGHEHQTDDILVIGVRV